MIAKRALITGITGQDGSYLAELLLSRGYEVIGTSRATAPVRALNIEHLCNCITLLPTGYDINSLTTLLKEVQPLEVYNLAGQTHVSRSWDMLEETFQASAVLPANLLEAIVRADRGIRFLQASSSEIFGLQQSGAFCEETPVTPANPYGCAKAFAHDMVRGYRQNYGLFAVNAILFNHESPRRAEGFASRKIVKTAVAIKLGKADNLTLGNLNVARDWTYAPDLVSAVADMLRLDVPQDLVIASGEAHGLTEMVEFVFSLLGLDYQNYLRTDKDLFRAAEPSLIQGDNRRARAVLGWRPRTSFRGMIEKMVDYEMRLQSGAENNFRNERPFE